MPADTAAQKACSYILNRIQTDPDLAYYIGPMTEAFHLLCVAQAEFTGEPIVRVERERAKDLQPEYRKRRAEVLDLRERMERVGAALERFEHTASIVGCGGMSPRIAELEDALKAIANEAGEVGRDLAWVRLHARAALSGPHSNLDDAVSS